MKRTALVLVILVAIAGAASLRAVVGRDGGAPKSNGAMTRTIPKAETTAAPNVPKTSRFAVPVLMYHRISDLSDKERLSPLMRDLTVSPADFDRQVRYLVDNGFAPLLAREVEEAVINGRKLPEKSVAITMDDGYKDNFDQAFPILQKYRVPATIFLVTNTVDTAGHLSWDDVALMHGRQVGYGSHTVHHYDLPDLSIFQIDYELRESRRVLESRLVETISSVAYPSGRYNQTVVERARAAGYLAGWKKGGGPVQPGAEVYLLPRVRVNGGSTMADFQRKVWSGANVLADRRDSEFMRMKLARKIRQVREGGV